MIIPSGKFIEVFKKTEGALSVTESVALINIAAQAPNGIYAEYGVAYGKSALSAIQSLKSGKFILVDPIFEDKEIKKEVEITLLNFVVGIELVADISLNQIPNHDNYSYVFIDSGSHQDGLPLQEVKLLEDRIVKNGVVAFHDIFSQFIEVEQAYNYLVSTGKFEPIEINWQEIIEYVNENNLEESNLSWHHQELKNPCFVGAVKRR